MRLRHMLIGAISTTLLVGASTGTMGAASAEPVLLESQVIATQLAGGSDPLSGRVVPVTASLKVDDLEGQTLQLWVKPAGTAAYTLAGTGVTNAYGTVTLKVRLVRSTRIRWAFPGTDVYAPSVSDSYLQRVRTRVSIRAPYETKRVGARVVVFGRTYPTKQNVKVALFRGRTAFGSNELIDPPPVLLVRGRTDSEGRYRLVVRFAASGTKRLFVRVARADGNSTGWSPYALVKID